MIDSAWLPSFLNGRFAIHFKGILGSDMADFVYAVELCVCFGDLELI